MLVCCECCVLSGRGLCDELITRPEESYRMWCVVMCDLEKQNLVNEEAKTHKGVIAAREKKKTHHRHASVRSRILGSLAKREKRLLALSCSSVWKYQCGCRWTAFHEIRYWWLSRKSVCENPNFAKIRHKISDILH
jgi:hypothetical protein